MPRPTDLDPNRLARWETFVASEDAAITSLMSDLTSKEEETEVAFALCWLSEELQVIEGLSESDIQSCGQSAAQIMFGRDPWLVAEKSLDLIKIGAVYTPGVDLAMALTRGDLDQDFGPGPDMRTQEGMKRILTALGVTSIPELLAKIGASSKEEAYKILAAESEIIERSMGRKSKQVPS